MKSINLKSPPSNLKATANFHIVFPRELQADLRDRLFALSPENRKEEWKKNNLDIDKINNSFKVMIKERNKFAVNKGFVSRLDMAMDWYGVSKKHYQSFEKNVDQVISLCDKELTTFQNLPKWFFSEFNTPCYVCQVKKFPLKSLEETFDYLIKVKNELKNGKKRIKYSLGSYSKTKLNEKSNTYTITIDEKLNTRHRIVDLIHEMSHVLFYMGRYKKKINVSEQGVLLREKETLEIEAKILKNLSTDLYKSVIYGETLALLLRTLFEIEIYKKPDQNFEKLYAKIFNRCYKNANQKSNQSFILDERIVFNPFASLPYVVANTTLLLQSEI